MTGWLRLKHFLVSRKLQFLVVALKQCLQDATLIGPAAVDALLWLVHYYCLWIFIACAFLFLV